MDIGVGDQVECVSACPPGPDEPPLTIGALYTIVGIQGPWPGCACECHGRDDAPGYDLAEMPIEIDALWCSLNFRKRPPHREALFRSLLEPTDVKEDA